MAGEQTIEPEVISVPSHESREPAGALDREDLVSLSKEAEGRVEAVKKIIVQALKVTSPFDWVKQGFGDKARPYLCASGAEKIANLFGVRITNVKAEKISGEDDKGRYYFYVYSCTGALPMGRTMEGIEGTCSSRDQFFAKEGEDPEGKTLWKPLSEVDETNIRKAAQSNMVVRTITSLIGLRNLSWEQLKAAGINIEAIPGVAYQSKSAAKTSSSIRTDQEGEGWRMALEMNENDPNKAAAYVKEKSSFPGKDGKIVAGRMIRDLSDKALEITFSKIKEDYKKFCEVK